MPEGDPSKFTRVLYGCYAEEIAETVLMTPIRDWFEALKTRAGKRREFNGFNQGFT